MVCFSHEIIAESHFFLNYAETPIEAVADGSQGINAPEMRETAHTSEGLPLSSSKLILEINVWNCSLQQDRSCGGHNLHVAYKALVTLLDDQKQAYLYIPFTQFLLLNVKHIKILLISYLLQAKSRYKSRKHKVTYDFIISSNHLMFFFFFQLVLGSYHIMI